MASVTVTAKRLSFTVIAIVIGAVIGVVGATFIRDDYRPITYASIALVSNTVPDTTGPALYTGGVLSYTHAICLNPSKDARVRLNAVWRRYDLDLGSTLQDPLINDIEIVLPPGCDRPTSSTRLPDFVVPGTWAFEISINVLDKEKHVTQRVTVQTVKFRVVAPPPERLPSNE